MYLLVSGGRYLFGFFCSHAGNEIPKKKGPCAPP